MVCICVLLDEYVYLIITLKNINYLAISTNMLKMTEMRGENMISDKIKLIVVLLLVPLQKMVVVQK